MRNLLATSRCLIVLFLALVACLRSAQCTAQIVHMNCGPQKTRTPPNIMFFATSDGELSPPTQLLASASTTQQIIYGRDGAKVGFEITTQSLSGVKSLTLTIPPEGLGTGTFRVDPPKKRVVCSLSQPDSAASTRFGRIPTIKPLLALSAGGVYPVTAEGVDRNGVTSRIEATYKVLDAQFTQSASSPPTLSWSSKNAIRPALYFLPAGGTSTSPILVKDGLDPSGTMVAGPGNYTLVVVSPNLPNSDISECNASKPADVICISVDVVASTSPPPEGWPEPSFGIYFQTAKPCDPTTKASVVVTGNATVNGSATSFAVGFSGLINCETDILASIGSGSTNIAVPPAVYDLTATSNLGPPATCSRPLMLNEASVIFNSNVTKFSSTSTDPAPFKPAGAAAGKCI